MFPFLVITNLLCLSVVMDHWQFYDITQEDHIYGVHIYVFCSEAMFRTWIIYILYKYRQISKTSRTKSQNLNVSHLVLQLVVFAQSIEAMY